VTPNHLKAEDIHKFGKIMQLNFYKSIRKFGFREKAKQRPNSKNLKLKIPLKEKNAYELEVLLVLSKVLLLSLGGTE